jgi:hypothetical protein
LAGGYGNVFGLAAFICFSMMFFTAAPQVRRGAWEVFYNTHILFFIPSIVLVSIHSKLCLFCAIPGVALWLFDCMLSTCNRFKYSSSSCLVKPLGSAVTKLRVPLNAPLNIEGGEFFFVNIPSISGLEWHPFRYVLQCKSSGLQ